MNKRFLSALALPAFLLPLATSAATPTPLQSLHTSIANLQKQEAGRLTGSITVDMKERRLVRDGAQGDGTVKISFSIRTDRPDSIGIRESEGSVMVENIRFTYQQGGDSETFALQQPITLDWKYTRAWLYFRVSDLPMELKIAMQPYVGDPNLYINRWFSIDLRVTSTTTYQRVKNLPNTPVPANAFRIMRIESRTKDANGHDILRIRARINSALIYAEQRAEIAKISRTDRLRTTKIQAINTRYAELRRTLLPMQFVFVVDTVDQRLLRLEAGGRVTEPQKTCSFNWTTGRSTCRTTGTRTVNFLGGISFLPEATSPIEAPADFTLFSTFLEQMREQMYPRTYTTSTMETMRMEDASTTITAP
jgi:hypothetical protein